MKKQSGFTLIELMVVTAIVAILAAIAFPSYNKHIQKARRSQAQQILLEIANRQEQYIIDARQYTATISNLNISSIPDGWSCDAQCSNNFYDVSVTVDNAATPPSYNISATAKNDQTSDGNLALNSTGLKTGTW